MIARMFDEFPGEAAAVKAVDSRLDYDSLADAVHFLTEQLAAAGVRPGTRVGLFVSCGYRPVVALCALGELAATVVMLDATDRPTAVAHRIRAHDVEFVFGDCAADSAVDEMVEEMAVEHIPVVVAEEYVLVQVAEIERATAPVTVVFDSDGRSTTRRWTELVDAARAVAEVARLDGSSTVSISESLLLPGSTTALVAAFLSGAAVSLSETPEGAPDPWVVAARLHGDEVTVLVGSASYIEALVCSGAVGVLAIPSLIQIVALDGQLDDRIVGLLDAAMPSVAIAYADTRVAAPVLRG